MAAQEGGKVCDGEEGFMGWEEVVNNRVKCVGRKCMCLIKVSSVLMG